MKRSFSYANLFGLLLLGGLIALAVLVSDRPMNSFDIRAAAFVQSFETAGLTQVMKFFSCIGSTVPVVTIAILMMAFLFVVLRHRAELVFFAAVLAGAGALNVLLKRLVGRERPSVHQLVHETGFSFPSGHTMVAFAMYGALAFLLWRHIPTRFGRGILIMLSGLLIAMIALSRIYLGVHYPSDIIGGILASGFWLALTIRLFERYMKRRQAA